MERGIERWMSSLSMLDQQRLERALGMEGYAVLDFTSEDLTQLVSDTIGHDLSDSRWERMGSSDASRLHALWEMAEDDVRRRCADTTPGGRV